MRHQRDHLLIQQAPVRQDVAQLSAVIAQDLADQQPAMAVARLSTAAHESKPMLRRSTQELMDRILEGRLLGHIAIERMTFLIKVLVALRTSAKRMAEEQVVDVSGRQRRPQLLAVELRHKPRVRVGPHIDHMGDLVAQHKSNERLDVVIGVPDSPYGWRVGHGLHMLRPGSDVAELSAVQGRRARAARTPAGSPPRESPARLRSACTARHRSW